MLPQVIDVAHNASLSDHCGVKLQISLKAVFTSKKKDYHQHYWKLNTSILQKEHFLPSSKSFWNEISKNSGSFYDIADWWDEYAKPCIRSFCMIFSIIRKRQRSQTKEFLLSCLKLAIFKKDWEDVCRVKNDLSKC